MPSVHFQDEDPPSVQLADNRVPDWLKRFESLKYLTVNPQESEQELVDALEADPTNQIIHQKIEALFYNRLLECAAPCKQCDEKDKIIKSLQDKLGKCPSCENYEAQVVQL